MLALETFARRVLPRPCYGVAWSLYSRLVSPVASLIYSGHDRKCVLCSSALSRFLPFRGRSNEKCPVCGSLKRHRLIWLYMAQETNLLDPTPKRMLHVAPEPPMTAAIREHQQIDYISADLGSPFAMEKMDITDIGYPDAHFDVIYCSHVLEHVEEDVQAMREFHRVLKPGGWAILQVPIVGERTFSDPAINTPDQRQRVYGHWDHVRIYGPDYQERLESAGFQVTADDFGRRLGEDNLEFYGIDPREAIHLCRKDDRFVPVSLQEIISETARKTESIPAHGGT